MLPNLVLVLEIRERGGVPKEQKLGTTEELSYVSRTQKNLGFRDAFCTGL